MNLNFSESRILVVGDLILDKYYHGSVTRISPEAPVPVVLKEYEKIVPGGAANVANNLKKLGARVSLAGITGNDNNGWLLASILKEENIPAHMLTGDKPTVTKIRIIGEHQQICRLDVEKEGPMAKETLDEFSELLEDLIAESDLVVLSDYNKGLINKESCKTIFSAAGAVKVPVIIDPKKKDWELYRGAFLVTPNLKEFREICHRLQLDDEDLVRSGQSLREKYDLTHLLVTLSAKGMMLINGEGHHHITTVKKEVFDVSGAGDTVIATLAACIAHGMDMKQSVEIANIAAGIVVGKFGTAPVRLDELQIACEGISK